MTEISRASQVLHLLQKELQRRSETHGAARARTPKEETQSSAVSRLRTIASREEYEEQEFNRSLIQAILAEKLGDRLVNDRRFQETVDDVLRIIQSDTKAQTLLMQAKSELLDK